MKAAVYSIIFIFLLVIVYGIIAGVDTTTASITATDVTGVVLFETAVSPHSEELAIENAVLIPVPEGFLVIVDFECEACGCKESWIAVAPSAKLFSCTCPETDARNVREYVAVVVGFE